MKFLTIFVSILALSLWLVPSTVLAETSPSSFRVPVVAVNGQQMGTALVTKQGDDLKMDYDFDEPFDCKLERISTFVGTNPFDLPITTAGPLDPLAFQYQDIYPNSRDAVLLFDLPTIENSPVVVSSRAVFTCNTGQRIAWVGRYPTYPFFVFEGNEERGWSTTVAANQSATVITRNHTNNTSSTNRVSYPTAVRYCY